MKGFPSPMELKNKIIIKDKAKFEVAISHWTKQDAKKLNDVVNEDEEEDEEEEK